MDAHTPVVEYDQTKIELNFKEVLMTAVAYPHIALTQDGTPSVAGTTTKVVEIVLDRLAHHWDAEEIQRQHPHLSLAQIYSALAYYHDHKAEIDRDIADRLKKVDQIAAAQPESAIRAKLREMENHQ